MSESNSENRWKSLADDLGLPPDHVESHATPVNPPVPTREPETPVVFAKGPAQSPRERIIITEDVLEITFGTVAPPEKEPIVVDAEIVEEIPVSVEDVQPAEGEAPRGASGRGRGDRGDRGDRGGRGRGRGGRRGERGGNNRGRGRREDQPVSEEAEILEAAPIQDSSRGNDRFGDGVEDDEIRFSSESHDSSNHEEHVHEEIADTHAPQPTAEEEEPFEEIDLGTWNVPSWNELIDSLYRPDR